MEGSSINLETAQMFAKLTVNIQKTGREYARIQKEYDQHLIEEAELLKAFSRYRKAFLKRRNFLRQYAHKVLK